MGPKLFVTYKSVSHFLKSFITTSTYYASKLFLSIFFLYIFSSSLSNAQEVAPLKKGNLWVYDWESHFDRITVVDTNFIIDTISYNHLKIESHSSIVYSRYVRLRNDSFYVIRRDTSYPAPYHEQLYYKKNAILGDNWVNPTGIDSFPMYYSIVDTFIANVFGQPVTVKELEIDGGLVFFTEFWTEEFGQLSRVDFFLQYFLIGCIIDGVVYGDTSFVVGIEYEDVPVSSFGLEQNYPNPFNPNTTIKYNIPTEGNVLLIVYNSLGEVVAELVNEWQPAGKYSVDFERNNLSSGVYLYSIKYRNQVIIKKMILLK